MAQNIQGPRHHLKNQHKAMLQLANKSAFSTQDIGELILISSPLLTMPIANIVPTGATSCQLVQKSKWAIQLN